MIIEINDKKTLEDISSEFSAYYPFLKIAFFDEPHGWQEASSDKHRLPLNKSIGEVRKRHHPGVLEIHSWHQTGHVEQEFRKLFGLQIQILRLQGEKWVQTAGTDELKLEEQNEIGRKTTEGMIDTSMGNIEKEKLL
jgi:hypothetical protein